MPDPVILPPGNAGGTLDEPYDCEKLEGCAMCCCEPIKVPFDQHVMAPFVEAVLSDGLTSISVGNESSPPRNHAAIRSFKFGTTVNQGGTNCEIEITDEAGSDFQRFFDKMVRIPDPEVINQRFWIHVRWGWLGQPCDNQTRIFSQTSHTFLMTKVDVNFGTGLCSFNIKGTDITPQAIEMVNRQSFGQDDQRRSLKDAIREVGNLNGCDIFYMRPGSLEMDAWEFQGGSGQPEGVWRSNGTNFLQTILNWISSFKTEAGNGIGWSFNSRRPPGSSNQLILWDGGPPECGSTIDPCQRSIGTYIVNGGNRSPVISFRPTINWTFGASGSGGAASPSSGVGTGGGTVEERPECQILADPNDQRAPNVGTQTMSIVNDNAIEVYGPRAALEESREATSEHSRVNTTWESVTAELQVQGDPYLADPIYLRGKTVSIIVIQPFHLQDLGGQCGEWLQTEPCNHILSNRAWLVEGCGHEVKNGSFTTTLKVKLDVPGASLNLGAPLGADVICGYQPS